jgi:hypothetical protein
VVTDQGGPWAGREADTYPHGLEIGHHGHRGPRRRRRRRPHHPGHLPLGGQPVKPAPDTKGKVPVEHDALTDFERVSLERLKLAADVILSETDAIPDTLETELTLFRERIERALLLPIKPVQQGN